ncbi:carboxypeptidase regulatory-like domain-containing protein [Solitalea sp. MAHUQ-68]|uniref:Carboxypeptidase regulatory-like domain-containing protein n=1 Tax=Solitalea agri TaxID=2953739 RepID=A0A9X2JAP2_9SPHI|nr:TonB-dependent receptor [Solitalea agri]MCO4291637.1 carboxypeptidase regulatory-like domain-containing protein [Solitalea agri]
MSYPLRKISNFFNVFLTVLILLCAFSSTVLAQVTTATISGIVTDKQGPMPGVTITAIHTPTGTKYQTSTRGDGRYNLPNVRVGGPYVITTILVGYKEEKQENIILSLGQNFKADFKIAESNVELAEVVVNGTQDKVFNSSRTGAKQTISKDQLQNMPTLGRSFSDFTKLSPLAGGSSVSAGSGTSFAGRSNLYNNFTVDGAIFNNAFGLQGTIGSQTSSQPINLDAFEEITVSVAPYDVKQSGFTGAAINAVTKSGTNEFSGSLNTYFRNESLIGDKIYNGSESPLADFSLKGYGFTFGGPILKNKLFFFASGELERRNDPSSSWVAGAPGATGSVSQAQAADLDALSNFLKTKYGYDAGAYGNFPLDQKSDKFSFKFDWNATSNTTVSLKYFYFRSYKDIAPSNSGAIGGTTGTRAPSLNGLPFRSAYYGINNNMDNLNAEVRTAISNKYSNELTVGYNRMRDFRTSLGNKEFPLVDIGNGSGQTYTSFGYEPFTANNKLNTDVFQFTDNFNMYLGKHVVTTGFNFEAYKTLNGFAPNFYGSYQFNTLADFYNSANNAVSNASKYQIQYSVLPNGSFPFAVLKTQMYGLYAQDEFSATENLKVTMGLRADLPIINVVDGQSNANVSALTFADGQKIDVSQFPKARVLWSPRLGFNWDLNGNGETQLRGGTGIFTGRPPIVWLSNQASNNGAQFGSQSTTNPTNRPFTDDVNAYRNPSGQTAANNTAYNLAVTANDFRFPQLWRSNLAVDQKLPYGIVATLEGTYASDLSAVYMQNINLNTAVGTALVAPDGGDKRIRYTASRIYGAVASPGVNTPQNPNISDAILMDNTSKGYSWTITGQLQKSFANGFSAMMAYTRSDSRSVNDGGSIAQSMWRDRQVSGDPNADVLSYSNYLVKNRFIASMVYRKEYIKHFATTISMFFSLMDGDRTSYVYNGDLNNDGLTSNDLIFIPRDKADIVLIPNDAADTRTPDQIWSQLDNYIKQDNYLVNHRGEYAKRNALITPIVSNLDLRIAQDLIANIGNKRNSLQFTFDMFNFGNLINPQWGVTQFATRANFLTVKSVTNGVASFSFPYLDAKSGTPLTSTFQQSTTEGSRWRIQFGLKYKFN